MPQQPQVPWYIAALVGAAISVCGFALVYNDPSFSLPAVAKFAIGCTNAALGVFGVYLNVRTTKPQ